MVVSAWWGLSESFGWLCWKCFFRQLRVTLEWMQVHERFGPFLGASGFRISLPWRAEPITVISFHWHWVWFESIKYIYSHWTVGENNFLWYGFTRHHHALLQFCTLTNVWVWNTCVCMFTSIMYLHNVYLGNYICIDKEVTRSNLPLLFTLAFLDPQFIGQEH
jgi:hypothetical protein